WKLPRAMMWMIYNRRQRGPEIFCRESNRQSTVIMVPIFSPWATRAMLPDFFMLKTRMGILRSMARLMAVMSITRRFSAMACLYVTRSYILALGFFLGSES